MSSPVLPRLKDVAEAANVSLSAASRILRGQHGRFGEETCQRVIAAAHRLGWRRNLLVNGMQTGRTQTIGVMIPPFDSFWVGVLSGIHSALSLADHLPITVWVGDPAAFPKVGAEDDSEGIAQINRLLDRRVDALILWPCFAAAYFDHFREIRERHVPVAVIDHESSADQIADCVETDEHSAAQQVADHLLQLGHRRIACLSTLETKWQAWAVKRRGFVAEAVQRCPGVAYRSWNVGGDLAQAVQIARDMLTEWRPTAVYAVTDHEAVAVYRAAESLGWHVPHQLSVIGFADLDFAASLSPPLTTVRQNPVEIGREAVRLVLERLHGSVPNDVVRTVGVGTELIVRQSTCPVRSAQCDNLM